jgi:hypothetical protein
MRILNLINNFPETVRKTEPKFIGDIDEKNNTINLCPIVINIRRNPYTCIGVTQPGFRLATLRERIPDNKGFLPACP